MPCPPLPSHGRATNALPRTRRPALPVSHVASAHEKPMSRRGEFEFFLFFFIGRGVWKKHNEGGQKRGRWEGVYHVNTWMMELRNRHPNNHVQSKIKDKKTREREKERERENLSNSALPCTKEPSYQGYILHQGNKPSQKNAMAHPTTKRESLPREFFQELPTKHTHTRTHSPLTTPQGKRKKKKS